MSPSWGTVARESPVVRSHASRPSAAAIPAPFWNVPPTYSVLPRTWRAMTFPLNAGPGALQNGAQPFPFQTARKSASGSPPAFWNVPPA